MITVFIHGLGCAPTDFDGLKSHLEAHTQCMTFALPRSFSEVPEAAQDNLIEFCTKQLISEIGDVGEISIVAHSLGSAIALPACEELIERLDSVVIIEGNLTEHDCGLLSRTISSAKSESDISNFIDSIAENNSRIWKTWGENARSYQPDVLKKYSSELVMISESGSLLDIFSKLTCKKLYIYGDDYINSETINKIDDEFLSHISGAGHFVMIEDPDHCADCIVNLQNWKKGSAFFCEKSDYDLESKAMLDKKLISADRRFIKNFENSPDDIELPRTLYMRSKDVRDHVLSAIRKSGKPSGSACVENFCFSWSVAKLDGDLGLLSVEARSSEVKHRVLVIRPNEHLSS